MLEARSAFRSLARSRGFTAAVVLTLALGIGANAALFSVVYTILLRPAPYPVERPDEVYVIQETYGDATGVAYLDYRDWQERSQSFETLAAFRPSTGNVTNVDDPFRTDVLMVTWDYFPLMGAQPTVGRLFTPQEDSPDGPTTAVLSHLLWVNRFGADAGVIGKTIHLNYRPRVIIGVLPVDFELIPTERLYVDLSHFGAGRKFRNDHDRIHAIGRLNQGVGGEQAQAEMTTIAEALEQEYPATNAGVGAFVTPLRDFRTGELETMLYALFGAVGLVLLIACSNVANLQLARGAARVKETAVRAALGAGRARLVKHSLWESLILSVFGAITGTALAACAFPLLRRRALVGLPMGYDVEMNWTVVVFSFVVALVTGVVFGLAPALRSAGAGLERALKSGSRSAGDGRVGVTLRRAFLFAQTALAMTLLVGAGLLVRTVQELGAVDPGFRAQNLLTFRLTTFGGVGEQINRREIFRSVKERIGAIPGIESVSFGQSIPLRGSFVTDVFAVDGFPPPPPSEMPVAAINPVDANYFETFGMQLIAGRTLSDFDDFDSAPVIIVNETLAGRFWPAGDAIGHRIRPGRPEEDWRRVYEIVGVVRSAHQNALDEPPTNEIFIPVNQHWTTSARYVMRTKGEPLALTGPVRRAVAETVPELPIDELRSMDQVVDALMLPRMVTLNLFLTFAVLAVVLAALGLYAVLAYSVAGRTREFGVRMAVGADRKSILGLVLKQELVLTSSAVACGVPAAFALGKSMEGVLFGVGGLDVAALCGAAGVLLAAALAACYVPARRAALVEPTTALREE